jgi:hypothetical protein
VKRFHAFLSFYRSERHSRYPNISSLPGKWSLASETIKEGQTIMEAAQYYASSELGIELDEVSHIDTLQFNNGNEEKILYYMRAIISTNPNMIKMNLLS